MRRNQNNNEKPKVNSGGVGFFGLLFLIFLWLKLNPGGNFDTPIANWSWWLVTLPLWGPLALAAVIFIVWFISYIFLAIAGKK